MMMRKRGCDYIAKYLGLVDRGKGAKKDFRTV